ncbi:hypothetical protein LEP1GSC047_2223 [Leptospira inadai serovar Lyme str. 10]|uniref:Uncharacterized protein n=1 Tax=Leptospira inadai serovar Lyme str. 10 TaxID=1049790 RepID=V6HPH7_9LEPT|nr:hypothetical protein LEP1GSC047_2223 [Leptospira inadai serovar Lyme str. 10]
MKTSRPSELFDPDLTKKFNFRNCFEIYLNRQYDKKPG